MHVSNDAAQKLERAEIIESEIIETGPRGTVITDEETDTWIETEAETVARGEAIIEVEIIGKVEDTTKEPKEV